jgi:hypothetical protein
MRADDFIRFLVSEYLREVLECSSDDELAFLLAETKGRRRFQGFGHAYGNAGPQPGGALKGTPTEAKPLARVSGGSFRTKTSKAPSACPLCGGELEVLDRLIPASEAEERNGVFVWRSPPNATAA